MIGKGFSGPIMRCICKAYGDWVGKNITGLSFVRKKEKAELEKESAELRRERLS